MRPHLIAAGIAVCTVVVAVGACTPAASEQATPTSTTSSRAAALRLDPQECARPAPAGHIDRTAYGLHFTTGRILVAISGNEIAGCYSFAKSGNAAPEVPPDSLLFTFTGPGTDGAQLEFLAGDLAGRVLPPMGAQRPSIGPLHTPIAAQVGISVNGRYVAAPSCRLQVTALHAELGAGSFTCGAASAVSANPFDPDDSELDEGPPASEDTSPPAPTYQLSGWFALTP